MSTRILIYSEDNQIGAIRESKEMVDRLRNMDMPLIDAFFIKDEMIHELEKPIRIVILEDIEVVNEYAGRFATSTPDISIASLSFFTDVFFEYEVIA